MLLEIQHIFLYNFSNLFVLLIGLNFTYVFLSRPKRKLDEQDENSNYFFFDILDEYTSKGIKKISSLKRKKFGKMEQIDAEFEFKISTGNLKGTTLQAFRALKEEAKSEYSLNLKDIDLVEKKYIDKLKKKTEASHLHLICSFIGLYGLLLLVFAAINETLPTFFLFWSNILVLVALFFCVMGEGYLWSTDLKEEWPKYHKVCHGTNKILHPTLFKVAITFVVMFILFSISLNDVCYQKEILTEADPNSSFVQEGGLAVMSPSAVDSTYSVAVQPEMKKAELVNINEFYPSSWFNERRMVYITIIIFLSGFVGYFLWNSICLGYMLVKYSRNSTFREINEIAKHYNRFLKKYHKKGVKTKGPSFDNSEFTVTSEAPSNQVTPETPSEPTSTSSQKKGKSKKKKKR